MGQQASMRYDGSVTFEQVINLLAMAPWRGRPPTQALRRPRSTSRPWSVTVCKITGMYSSSTTAVIAQWLARFVRDPEVYITV